MLIFRALCYLLGTGTLVFALYYNGYASQFQSWTTTPAELHSISGFHVSRDLATSEHESNFGRVSYSFEVAGKRYVGYRVLPLQDVYLPPEKMVGLEPGNIRVSYNPDAPEQSFIYADKPVQQLRYLMLAGLLLIFIGIFIPPILSRIVDYIMEPPRRVDADYLD